MTPKYPFDPSTLDALPEELAELFRSLEMKLLEEICSRLKIADNLNEVTVQGIRALRSHGISLDGIRKAIRETTGISEKKLDKLFDDVVTQNQVYYTSMINLAQMTAPEALINDEDVQALRRQTWSAMKNITGSTGFLISKSGRLTMLPPAQAYQWALDNAEMQIQSGAISYNQAIYNGVKQLADSGLKTIDYESGVHRSIDSAVRTCVMTGINQLNSKYREQSMEYLETDLVEVTAHLGARNIQRPGEPDFAVHTNWQGKVFRWADKPMTSTGQYPDFELDCGYGDVQGILGANCRHSFWPFIEGVSERTYTDEKLEDMKPENRPKIEFEGKLYDDYQATQVQRQIEADIRKQKRRKAAFEAAGLIDDAITAGARLQRLNQKYRDFSKVAGLPEQGERANVYRLKSETLENTAERGMLNNINVVHIPITDEAIKNIPLIQPTGWDEAQAKSLQDVHRGLLRLAKDYPVGTEAVITLDENFGIIDSRIGGLGTATVPEVEQNHILLHNHPDGLLFSHTDLKTFIWRGSTIMMSAVGNNGAVYALLKKGNYDGFLAYLQAKDFDKRVKSFIDASDVDGYIAETRKIIEELKNFGIEFIERTAGNA